MLTCLELLQGCQRPEGLLASALKPQQHLIRAQQLLLGSPLITDTVG